MPMVSMPKGVVRAMTRSVETRATAAGDRPDAGMSLIDKLNLLQLLAEQPPEHLGRLISQVRQGGSGNPTAVYQRIRDIVEGKPALPEAQD